VSRRSFLAALTGLLLIAAALRIDGLTGDRRLHPDEALFATFARNAAVRGDWMLTGPLDKTPLSLYAAALSMHALAAHWTDSNLIEVDPQAGEFAARLPNLYAGLITVALITALARSLGGGDRASMLAALLAAASPYLIAYDTSAFTDGFMLMFGAAAALNAARGRSGWAGGLLAFSIASKQQGIFFLPTILFVTPDRGPRSLARAAIWLALGIGLLLLWDALRPGTSLFALASVNNNPERVLIHPDELLPRLIVWLRQGSTLLGVLTWPLVALALVNARRDHFTAQLLIFCGGYGLLHWIGAFNTYDRYLLPLIPALAVAAARSIPARRAGVCAVVALALIGALRIDHDTGARQGKGLLHLAAQLNAQPLGAIVYDRWLGWELGYYLGVWTETRRTYYPTPDALASDALVNADPAPRYFVAPVEQAVSAWIAALDEAGFSPRLFYSDGEFAVWRLIPPWAVDPPF
jgi:4-amino-4-deoxy-L-arabinose transferase-like glycosyltransferase